MSDRGLIPVEPAGFEPAGFGPGGVPSAGGQGFAPLFAPAGRFRADPRLNPAGTPRQDPEPAPAADPPGDDPLALARAEGLAEGLALARAEAARQAEAEARAREGLALAFARLDRSLEEDLRQRLRDTVAALCEAALAPLALDADALQRRVERAVAMLARADDDRVLRLHPADLPLLAGRLAQDWTVRPDPALERGALRVETAGGGVEDGPAQWRRAIAEALRAC